MARISSEELDRLKAQVSVVELAKARGIELVRRGKELFGLCPFHEEKTPSLAVSVEKNLFHCLGCGAGGSVIDWVQKTEGVSFRHAVEILRAGSLALSDGGPGPVVKQTTVPRLSCPVDEGLSGSKLLGQVADYYHRTLLESPEALSYLEQRGLRSSKMLTHFRLGFANRTLGLRLPKKNRKAGGRLRTELQRVGIFKASGHEFFNGSVVVPILDEQGQVVEMYGRKIGQMLRKGTPKHLYLPGPHRGVFNIAAFRACEELIVCESLIDALTFWCAGFRNVTASYGAAGFTEEHLGALLRYRLRRVLIAYDRDETGDRQADALSEKLLSEGLECLRVQFPQGMDANEFALKSSDPRAELLDRLERAMWMGKLPPAPSGAAGEEAALSLVAEAAPAAPAAAQPPVSAPALSPLPGLMPPSIPIEQKGEQLELRLGDRFYRVRGLAKNTSFEQLKINLLCARERGFFVDHLDLYSARQRAAYIKEAARELELEPRVLKADLGRVLLSLEQIHDEQLRAAMAPKTTKVALSAERQKAALELLRSPHLLERILSDFEACGIVGEKTNKLVGYLGACSRKLDEPLAIIIQSSSAAGKSSLMEALLSFIPSEERVKYSAMTGQSLFYMGEDDLKHKVLAIVEEEGAERASYALKLLQSEGELSIASTGKDPHTGRLVTHEYRVQGPVMIFMSTTNIEIDEELQNRCLVLTVDEEREQTRAIHRVQRHLHTLEGMWQKAEKKRLLKLHQDAQRLLRPLQVVNPYAHRLTFLDDRTRTRRDHMKYLTLILSIALLHQYQRPVKTSRRGDESKEYIEVTPEDIRVANELMHQVLGQGLDELPPQTRRMLAKVSDMVQKRCEEHSVSVRDYRFTRREVRRFSGWSDHQVKVHMRKLEELEYVLVHRGRRGQSFVYELLYDGEGQDGSPFVMGLLDPDELESAYDKKWEGSGSKLEGPNPNYEGSKRPQSAPKVPPKRVRKYSMRPPVDGVEVVSPSPEPKNAVLRAPKSARSYAQTGRNGTAGRMMTPGAV